MTAPRPEPGSTPERSPSDPDEVLTAYALDGLTRGSSDHAVVSGRLRDDPAAAGEVDAIRDQAALIAAALAAEPVSAASLSYGPPRSANRWRGWAIGGAAAAAAAAAVALTAWTPTPQHVAPTAHRAQGEVGVAAVAEDPVAGDRSVLAGGALRNSVRSAVPTGPATGPGPSHADASGGLPDGVTRIEGVPWGGEAVADAATGATTTDEAVAGPSSAGGVAPASRAAVDAGPPDAPARSVTARLLGPPVPTAVLPRNEVATAVSAEADEPTPRRRTVAAAPRVAAFNTSGVASGRLANGGFESPGRDERGGEAALPHHWLLFTSDHDPTYIAVTDDYGMTGQQSCRLTTRGKAHGFQGLLQVLRVEAGATYAVSAWVLNDPRGGLRGSQRAQLSIEWLQGEEEISRTYSSDWDASLGSRTWTQIEMRADAPEAANRARLVLTLYEGWRPGRGSFLIDGLEMTVVP